MILLETVQSGMKLNGEPRMPPSRDRDEPALDVALLTQAIRDSAEALATSRNALQTARDTTTNVSVQVSAAIKEMQTDLSKRIQLLSDEIVGPIGQGDKSGSIRAEQAQQASEIATILEWIDLQKKAQEKATDRTWKVVIDIVIRGAGWIAAGLIGLWAVAKGAKVSP